MLCQNDVFLQPFCCNYPTMFSVRNGDVIRLNSSKSLLVRELIAFFLYRGELLDVSPADSGDVRVVHRCLQTLSDPRSHSAPVLVDVCDCGAAFRFLMAVLAVTEGEWLLTGTPRLLERPIEPLAHALSAAGADLHRTDCGWRISGRLLRAEKLTVDCTLSSQFASALLLIGPKIGLRDLTILPVTPPSEPYIAMTRRVVADVLAGTPFRREADWSTAAFWYAFLLLSPQVDKLLLQDLRLDSLQGDCFTNLIFKELGISSKQKDEGVFIEKNSDFNHNFKFGFDLRHNPDLAPVLAVTAAMLPLSVTLSGLENINLKESRRMDALVRELAPFVSIEAVDESTLRILGDRPAAPQASPCKIHTYGDHRLVMAFALLNLKYDIQLSDIECAKKSYPEFENYFKPSECIGK